jgi:hypothetical protein
VENPQNHQNTRQAQEEDSHLGEGKRKRTPRLTNHNPKDLYFHCQYHGRGHSTEGCPETKKNMAIIQQEKALMSIASSIPNQFRLNFW